MAPRGSRHTPPTLQCVEEGRRAQIACEQTDGSLRRERGRHREPRHSIEARWDTHLPPPRGQGVLLLLEGDEQDEQQASPEVPHAVQTHLRREEGPLGVRAGGERKMISRYTLNPSAKEEDNKEPASFN